MRSSRNARRPVTAPVAGLVTALVTALALTGCGSGSQPGSPSASGTAAPSEHESTRSTAAPTARDVPLSWGPTERELAEARELVADWTPARLAGQVIVGRYHGTDPQAAGRLVADLHLAGAQLTSANITSADQVRATTAAISKAVARDGRDFPAVVGVDQEGGAVSHLRGITTDYPAFAEAGEAVAADRANGGRSGQRAVSAAARTTGLELRELGFTWVFAPVADVSSGDGDAVIGSRSASSDADVAATATAAAVRGYNRAGIVSTVKHFPGHGAAHGDSHVALPRVDAGLPRLQAHDLKPFRAAVRAGAPVVMLGHLQVPAIGVRRGPASLSPAAYDFLAEEVGFDGVTLTDSLGMGPAVSRPHSGVTALNAGADLLLMPADTRATHRRVARAIATGKVPRDRIEDAAARVVALQRWQARVSEQNPVPADVTARAQRAAQDLRDAG